MIFTKGHHYLDRQGNEYEFSETRGGVLVFKDVKTGANAAQNSEGRYRWDGQDHPRDMIVEIHLTEKDEND